MKIPFFQDLRNKRCDLENMLNGENRMEDNISRELGQLRSNHSEQTAALETARQHLHSFQLDKQRKLNNLDAVLVCNREQTEALEAERLAGTADSSDPLLAFPKPVLSSLHSRTEELKQEKNATKHKYKEARTMFETLQLECRSLRKSISATNKRCEVEMEKRFGAGVSLETLEGFAVNRTLEEMKEASRAKEKSMWRIQNKRDDQIKEVRYALHDHVLINTKFLQRRTAAILARQANKTTRQKTAELMERNRAKASSDFDDEKELKEMIEIFQQQSEEIMELKALLVRYVMKGIAVDPTTGKKDLRARPSIAELTRPKSSRARLRSSRIGQQQAPVTVQTVERLGGGGAIQRRPATSQIQLRL